ncbi:MAG: hypothetical protein Q8Q42_02105 [Nanoarchaeota archaeon]|nr:hypothetical protein [Nanoarchaeota archaeon]
MDGKFRLSGARLKHGKKNLIDAYNSVPQPTARTVLGSEFFSNSPPSVFIGSKLKYPCVNVGIMAPPVRVEDSEIYDSHQRWVGENVPIGDILKYRGNLINSRFQSTVHAARGHVGGKFFDAAREVGMAKNSVDMEIHLKKKVRLELSMDKVSKPIGAKAELKNVRLTENIKVERNVDKVFSDTDLKAGEALEYLYEKHVDDQKLSQLLSLGTLGIGKNRRLVPTRWSITTVDDTLGKKLIKEIKDHPVISDYTLLFGNFLGNYYIVLLFPEIFSYELFELYLPGSSWNPGESLTVSTDYESYGGRKSYASNCVGGYYAARLPLLEYLNKIKRQASALVVRFETPDYWAGLGVWVVRESMKKTMDNSKRLFAGKEEMLNHARAITKEEFNFNLDEILKRSRLLESIKSQMKLTRFF